MYSTSLGRSDPALDEINICDEVEHTASPESSGPCDIGDRDRAGEGMAERECEASGVTWPVDLSTGQYLATLDRSTCDLRESILWWLSYIGRPLLYLAVFGGR